MNNIVLLALVEKMLEDKLLEIQSENSTVRGPRGFRGMAGESFNFSEHEETIKQWAKDFSLKFDDLLPEQIESLKGLKGTDGKDFSFEDSKENIETSIKLYVDSISEKLSLKFDSLTPEQVIEITGKNGIDGKDFSFEDSEQKINNTIRLYINSISERLSLKYENLTEEQKESLQGKPGQAGLDGKGFDFQEHQERITEIITLAVDTGRESLRLKFSDLTEDELDQLKGREGRPGRPGRDGKGFDFEEEKQGITDIVTSSLQEMTEALKLKFSDLTPEEVETLKLRFIDITPDELKEIKGPRGQRGRQGTQGEIGEKGDRGEPGEQGLAGQMGPRGIQGIPGVVGRVGRPGSEGVSGKNAPQISEIEIETYLKEMRFRFTLSDGEIFYTNWVELPVSKTSGFISMGGGGTSPGTSVVVTPEYLVSVNIIDDGSLMYISEVNKLYDYPTSTGVLEELTEGAA
jgi:hypothetical protein